MDVKLNVYDVTNTQNENTNNFIMRLNGFFRSVEMGGVFHGALELEDSSGRRVEWSFGYCESGTGVYCCPARTNSMYAFREAIELGVTTKSRQEIRDIIIRFKRAWPGTSYDLLQRNCCHFCEELCQALEVAAPPAWLNRFAQSADATVKFTNEASAMAKRVGSNITSTAQQSASWLREATQRMLSQVSQGPGTGPTSSSEDGEADGGTRQHTPGGLNAAQASGRGAAGSVADGAVGGKDSDMSALDEPVAVTQRLASRLRHLAGRDGGGDGGSSEAAGLPPSTSASTCASSDSQTGQHRSGGPGSRSLPDALRQKWQELEASAGDGTKQFLYGLIKPRQAKLDEEGPLSGESFTRGGLQAAQPLYSAPLPGPQAPGTGASVLQATLPPTPQVSSNNMVANGAGAAAMQAAALSQQSAPGPAVSLAARAGGGPCEGAAQQAALPPAVPVPPAKHLLDM